MSATIPLPPPEDDAISRLTNDIEQAVELFAKTTQVCPANISIQWTETDTSRQVMNIGISFKSIREAVPVDFPWIPHPYPYRGFPPVTTMPVEDE